ALRRRNSIHRAAATSEWIGLRRSLIAAIPRERQVLARTRGLVVVVRQRLLSRPQPLSIAPLLAERPGRRSRMNERELNMSVLDARDDLVGVFEPALFDRAVSFAEHELGVFTRDRFLDGRPRGGRWRSTDTRGSLRAKFTANGKRRRLRQGNE